VSGHQRLTFFRSSRSAERWFIKAALPGVADILNLPGVGVVL
jgi:hypothetical protein